MPAPIMVLYQLILLLEDDIDCQTRNMVYENEYQYKVQGKHPSVQSIPTFSIQVSISGSQSANSDRYILNRNAG